VKQQIPVGFAVMEFVLPLYDSGWFQGRFVLRFRALKSVRAVMN